MILTRGDLVEYARECLGTPFMHQGRICQVALDCVGVVVHMIKRANQEYYDLPVYSKQPYKDQLVNKVREQPCFYEIAKRDLKDGDIFICKVSRVYPQHLAVIDGDYIIHANGIKQKCERVRFTRGFYQTVTNAFSWTALNE